MMSRTDSKENILQRNISVKEISRSEKHYLNAVYDEDLRDTSDDDSNQFMVEVNLGKKQKRKKVSSVVSGRERSNVPCH